MDTEKKYDYLVFIGRMEPFHNGHLAVAKTALNLAHHLIILLGSADTPRTIKNPWSVGERTRMILSALPAHHSRVTILGLRDSLYNEAQWQADVQRLVTGAIADQGDEDTPVRIGLIGKVKDASSYYLKEFPQWELVDVSNTETLSATELRHYLYEANQVDSHGGLNLIHANVPDPVFQMLDAFRKTSPVFPQLVREYHFIKEYKKQWANAPYPPTFVTTDAVVTCSGHVLLVKRKAEPGKGLWALPGGFIQQEETLLDGCIRELREETRLKVPTGVLKGSLKAQRVFDHPERSQRGRTITHAFHFDLPNQELPEVKGSDDAEKAKWLPISEFLDSGAVTFEDHLHIVTALLGVSA